MNLPLIIPDAPPLPQTETSGPDFARRRKLVLDANLARHPGLEAVIIGDPLDILYLTGTGHGISWLVLGTDSAFALSRHMLIHEVRAEARDCEILLATGRSIEQAKPEAFLCGQLAARGIREVSIDPARISALSYLKWTAEAGRHGIRLHEIPECAASARSVKGRHEIAMIRRCTGIAEEALAGLLEQGAPGLIGRTERELAVELEARMIALGADRQGFPETGIIVASGPNSASAHHSPGLRRIAAGDPLLIDWGAEVAGYRSDMTRTHFVRSIPEFATNAYPVVELALHRAAALLAPGAALSGPDLAARDTVMDAGYEEFHYGVGHGVGLAIHEAPWLRADATGAFAEDMITTIEPGIYLHGTGGIRIENLYQITRRGADCLSRLPTDLASMLLP